MKNKSKKILIAPDKFKGTFTACEIANEIQKNILLFDTENQIKLMPLADGGEGTAEVLAQYSQAEKQICRIHDPYFRPIKSEYYFSPQSKTAYIESAKACGLALLQKSEYNPCETTSFGVGELIADAVKNGAEHIILTIGGTATSDAGIGMAAALGFQFSDAEGKPVKPAGKYLADIEYIINPTDNLLEAVNFTVLCDVENTLFGSTGAAFVYAGQKGASYKQTIALDKGLRRFNTLVNRQFNYNFTDVKFSGAGGGLAAGASVFLNADLRHGTSYILNLSDIETEIRKADLIITGEGKLDRQTLSGKLVKGICDISKKYDKKTAIICGHSTLSHAEAQSLNAEIFPLFKAVSNINNIKTQSLLKLTEITKQLLSDL